MNIARIFPKIYMKDHIIEMNYKLEPINGEARKSSYSMEVEINGIQNHEVDPVKWAVANVWDYHFIFGPDVDTQAGDDGHIKFFGYVSLAGNRPAQSFARQISQVVWDAVGGYRPVRVYATVSENYPCDEYETVDADLGPSNSPKDT